MNGPVRRRRVMGTAVALAALLAAALAGCAVPASGSGAAAPAQGAAQAQGAAPAQGAASAQGAAAVPGSAVAAHVTARAASAATCNPLASLRPPAGPPAVTGGSWAARIQARGYLIAGVDQSTYHFGYLNPLDRQIEGFDIDMILAVARAIFGPSLTDSQVRAKIHFVAISDNDRIPDVQNGTVDIVAHTMTINCQRLTQVDFSTVYFEAHARVLVLKPAEGSAPPTLAKLGSEHDKVCATQGSDSVAVIQSYHGIPVQEPYWTDCLVLLQEGQVAGVTTDDSILDGLAAQDPFTVVTGPNLTDEPYGLAISQSHPDFVRFVNAVLQQERTDGQWAASYARWVGTPVAPIPHAEYAS